MVRAMGIAEALRDLRVGAEFDQGALAARAEIRQGDISHYEVGDRSPRIDHVLAIERACNVSPGTAFVMAGFVDSIGPLHRAILTDTVLSPKEKDVMVRLYQSLLAVHQARDEEPLQ